MPLGGRARSALDARLVSHVGVIGGFDFRHRDLVDVANVVVEVLSSGGMGVAVVSPSSFSP